MGKADILSLKEIQDLQYELLCFFADYCERNNLKYCLFGGTLLGAIRHNDFIPWDDDVDVCMPRPDYDRFINLTSHENWPNYKLEHYQTPFIKLVDERYGFHERLLKDCYREESLFIDIFPVDGVPSQGERRHFATIKKALRKLEFTILAPSSIAELNGVHRLIRKTAIMIWNGRDPNQYIQAIDDEARRYPYEDSTRVSCCVWGWAEKDISLKKDFEAFVKMRFRDRSFWCQGNYDESLHMKYGDYMCLPPESDRQHEHGLFWKR